MMSDSSTTEEPAAPPVQRSRTKAGRDLPAAIGVGVGLAALIIVSLARDASIAAVMRAAQ